MRGGGTRGIRLDALMPSLAAPGAPCSPTLWICMERLEHDGASIGSRSSRREDKRIGSRRGGERWGTGTRPARTARAAVSRSTRGVYRLIDRADNKFNPFACARSRERIRVLRAFDRGTTVQRHGCLVHRWLCRTRRERDSQDGMSEDLARTRTRRKTRLSHARIRISRSILSLPHWEKNPWSGLTWSFLLQDVVTLEDVCIL